LAQPKPIGISHQELPYQLETMVIPEQVIYYYELEQAGLLVAK
jgi:hypothetical protein